MKIFTHLFGKKANSTNDGTTYDIPRDKNINPDNESDSNDILANFVNVYEKSIEKEEEGKTLTGFAEKERPESSSQASSENTKSIWRTFSVFISSTFADMQAERDHLKNVVFPKIEEELQKRHIKLEIVDLRWGVDTASIAQEDERESSVLKVCLDEIKRCRPFFIGLLGDRYGWVPPFERMKAALVGEQHIKPEEGKSVTDLEVEFGVLASEEQLVRSRFYFRNSLPYETFSPARAAMYSDAFIQELTVAEKIERKEALERLKFRIVDHFKNKGLDDNVKGYSAVWDAENEKVTGLDTWGDLVYEDILKECENHAKDTWSKVPQNWQEQELSLLEGFNERNTDSFCGRKNLLENLKKHLLGNGNTHWGLVLTGESGSGKSAVFSMVNKMMQHENCFVLAHSAGISPRAKSVTGLLRIWNLLLSNHLGIEDDNKIFSKDRGDVFFLTDIEGETKFSTTIEKLQQKFLELLRAASEKKRVILLIDALDRFEPTARAQHLSWLPEVLPPNIRMLCTAVTGTESKAVQYHKGLKTENIDIFAPEEAGHMLVTLCKKQHKSLPSAVERIILEKKREDGQPATASPLWLSLAVSIMMTIDRDDFEKISRLEGRGDQQIERYMTAMANDFAPLPGALFLSLLKKAGQVFGEEFTTQVFNYIACSRGGLREKDLENLLTANKINWDVLRFAGLRRWFKAHLVMEGEELQWNLAHAVLRNTLMQNLTPDKYTSVHYSIATHFLTVPDKDSLRISETMFHFLESGKLKEAAMYYAEIESSVETDGATKVLAEAAITNDKGMSKILQLPELLNSNFDLFHELLKKYVVDLDDAVAAEGNLPQRLKILSKLQDALPVTYDYNNADFEFAYSLTNLFLKAGVVLSVSGQMGEALKFFEICEKMSKELFDKNPLNSILRHLHASSLFQVGIISVHMGLLDKAMECFNNSIKLLQEIPATDPVYKTIKKSLSSTYLRVGNIHQDMGQMEPALHSFETASEIIEELQRNNPLNQSINLELGNCYQNLGRFNQYVGNFDAALEYYERSFEISNKLYTSNPNIELLKKGLALSYAQLGWIHQERGQMGKAIECYELYKKYFEELYYVNTQSVELNENLVLAYGKLGDLYTWLKLHEEALKYYEESFRLINDILLNNSEIVSIKITFINLNLKLGKFYQDRGQRDKAVNYFEFSFNFAKQLYEANSLNVNIKMSFADSNSILGSFHKESGNWDEALKYFDSALELMKEIYSLNSNNQSIKKNLSHSYRNLGEIFQILGKAEEALSNYNAAYELMEQLFLNNPNNNENKENLSAIYEKLGIIHQEMGQTDKAIKNFDGEVKLLKELILTHNQRDLILFKLGLSFWKLGEIYGLKGLLNDALICYESCLGYMLELNEINSDSESNMNYIANVYGKIGDIFQVSGKQDGALEYYKKSLNIFQEILKINPGSNSYKEGLVTTYNQLAELNQNQGNLIEAFNNYLAANELLSELNKTNPTDINIYTRWGISFYKISMILKAMNDNENGQQYFLLWKKMIEFLVGRYPDVSDFKQWNALTY